MPSRRRRTLIAAAALALMLIGLLAWQALSGSGAAVIGCQVLAMTTVAYGPYLVWRHRHPREPDDDGR
ncbi:MAG: hypothetical protein Q7T55_04130 [Solirubrobacteraceae bacterium]|nr:hypothetical protein [Solirubrobacteraceae bacterium]